MKINFKNIIVAVTGGILGIVLFVSISQRVEGLDTIFQSPLTTIGGTISLEHFQLARKHEDREYTDNRSPNSVLQSDNENAVFRMVGSSIFNNFLSFGQTRFDKLAIGYNDRNVGGAKLSINGTITIKGLAHDGSTEVKACINDFGVIQACAGGVENPPAKDGHTWSCVKGKWISSIPINKPTCSPVNYDSALDLIYPDGSSACIEIGTSPSDNCGISGTGGGTGTGTGGGTITSGTKYDCGQDGNWHRILVSCSPAISSPVEFFDKYGVQCGDQSAIFNNVCFESNPTNTCLRSSDPPCAI